MTNQNPYKQLSMMVDAVEKLAFMPESEVIQNKQLVADIKNAFSAHSIDTIINSAMSELREAKNTQTDTSFTQQHLLRAYAERESDRIKNDKGAKDYITKIINANENMS